ncbi:proton-conducting transporter membrane subunit [Halomonas sp. HP20-15]|uniref:NADH-quinone oxidoreductase subunit 5 family protein n=1 Tax=Halomonas sp. HP20-15 TaxID=3085901 RepID=UPI002981284D|nr:proton-conducting transporter membrane subunit [Halomonas sp. HP20-15]MDW5378562.1 proton-conducting transporter membrane subunit [Halomonas sp. HP20-15]
MLWSLGLLPIGAAALLYLGGARLGRIAVTASAALAVLATLGLAALALATGWGEAAYRWSDVLALTLAPSDAAAVFTLAVPLIALPIIVYAGFHELPPGETGRGGVRLLALLVAFVGAMQLLVLADDLLMLLIAWELIGACSWALIGYRWGEAEVTRDALTAFLTTRCGDLGLYVAAAAVFAGSGGFGYADLAALEGPLLDIAVAGIVLAAAAKSAQLPFSAWLFAAMAGPVSVSALLHAATLVAAGLYLLARLQPILDGVAWFVPLVIAIGLTTALAGAMTAICQGHAKKLLAASTSSQYGLMWLAVGAGFPAVALVHFVAHAFMKAGLFLSAGLAAKESGGYELAGMRLGRRLPGVAATTLVSSLALAGMIPLGSAWSKEQVASAASQQSLWLALGVALAGGLSALYATRFQRLAYGRADRQTHDRLPPSTPPTRGEIVALRSLAAGTLLLSILWWPPAHQAVAGWLATHWPPSHLWLLLASLALVLAGIVGGLLMTRPGRRVEPASASQAVVAEWFGLTALLARVAGAVTALARRLARFDDARVDAGLHATARFADALARRSAGRGETLADGLPGGLSRLTDRAGGWARSAQSGQTHHYYSGIAIGVALVLSLLVIGVLL